MARRYRTPGEPLPGVIRQQREDFEVEELPLYEACGSGEHVYATIEKRGLPTLELVRRVARELGVSQRAIGYAGLKDARAVTRQTLSFSGVDPARLEGLEADHYRVLSVSRHTNKLKLGHLRGNRFRLRVRGAGAHAEAARAVLAALEAEGVPNYFGLQRFGRTRRTHLLGRALVAEDAPAAVAELLTPPVAAFPREAEAHALAAAGDYAAAAERFPKAASAERSVCRALAAGRDPAAALATIPLKLRRLYVSAFQSWLFNAYLSRRLERIGEVELGEVAWLQRNGACFVVEDLAAEAPRAAAHEISPSGPMFGRRLLRPAPGSSAYALEEAVLAELAPGHDAELSEAFGAKPLGQRRALRFPLTEPRLEVEGDDLWLGFALPRGCYATTVLEELLKRPVD
ncbi:MAG: tRNA pseudouridine(13) synthase TruD [Planctomycetes bacterium]|nr:tRNA pseudouridine(13) synthase TruD [Planctomycetota bacterium]